MSESKFIAIRLNIFIGGLEVEGIQVSDQVAHSLESVQESSQLDGFLSGTVSSDT